MEVICLVRLCKVVSVSCYLTMDVHSRCRHQRQGSHAGIDLCRMYEAVFQIIYFNFGQAVP